MLNPQKDRFIFRDVLTSPYEWELEKAVATTYSLDITALISCMIPLAFSDDVSSHIFKNKIATFTALRNLSKKLVVFSDCSQIKTMNFQKEFALLLENMIVPVGLKQTENGDYPSFHPKMWLLQFRNKDGEHFYRLVVLSRNISYDKCYDACFVLESSDNHLKTKRTKPIIEFLEYLSENTDTKKYPMLSSQKKLISDFIGDLISEKVCFSLSDERFFDDDFDVYPLFDFAHRKSFEKALFEPKKLAEKEKYDSAFLMSPFVAESFLNDIISSIKSDVKTTLITRKQAAESIDEKYNHNFDGYILNDAIVEPNLSFDDNDEEIEKSENDEVNALYDIHAKIFALRKKKHTDFYIGSANATYSALNKNVELMVRIGCDKKDLSPESIFSEINQEDNPLFEKISFTKKESEEVTIQKQVEHFAKLLAFAKVTAAVFAENGKYRIEINFSSFPELSSEIEVFVSPLAFSEEKVLAEKMQFDNVPLESLSEFYVLKVLYKTEREEEKICIERMIKIPTENIPYKERESAIVNKIISDKDSFAEYVMLFLSKTPTATQSELLTEKESNAKWKVSNTQSPLYETLLKASVLNPNAIRDLEQDLKLLNNTIVSDEFRMMYKEFLKAIENV